MSRMPKVTKPKAKDKKAKGKIGKKKSLPSKCSQPEQIRLVRSENLKKYLDNGWKKVERYDAGDRYLQAGLKEGTLIAIKK